MEVKLDVSEEAADAYIREGATRFLQNKVQPAWEKAEAERLGLWKTNAKGKIERPKDYTRKDIPFSDESAQVLTRLAKGAEIATGAKGEDGKPVLTDAGVSDCVVSLYEGGTIEYKYAAVQKFIKEYLAKPSASGAPRTIELFCENRGLPTPTEPWADDTEFLALASEWYSSQD